VSESPPRRLWRLLARQKLSLHGWQRSAAFALFGVLCFLFFVSLTFPDAALRARLQSEADRAGLVLRMEDVSAGLFGATASRVRLSRASDPGGVPLMVDRLTVRPMLFPPGLSVRAALFGGTAAVSLASSGRSLGISLAGIDLSRSNLKDLSGADAEGKLDGRLTLDLPAGRGGEPQLAAASGELRLNGQGLLLRGGTVTVPIAGTPTPVDLPRAALGALDAAVSFQSGSGTVQRFRLKGDDLEATATGTLKLAPRVEYVELALALKLKLEAEFLKRLGVIGVGYSALPPDAEQQGFRDARLGGYLGKPSFTPGR
jgi:type II secretion system protein N